MDEAMRQRAEDRARRMRAEFVRADTSRPPVDADPASRFASVWQLSCDLWRLTGRPWPTYQRANMPGRVRNLRDDCDNLTLLDDVERG